MSIRCWHCAMLSVVIDGHSYGHRLSKHSDEQNASDGGSANDGDEWQSHRSRKYARLPRSVSGGSAGGVMASVPRCERCRRRSESGVIPAPIIPGAKPGAFAASASSPQLPNLQNHASHPSVSAITLQCVSGTPAIVYSKARRPWSARSAGWLPRYMQNVVPVTGIEPVT